MMGKREDWQMGGREDGGWVDMKVGDGWMGR